MGDVQREEETPSPPSENPQSEEESMTDRQGLKSELGTYREHWASVLGARKGRGRGGLFIREGLLEDTSC